MTVDEKRKALDKYCDTKRCFNCVLEGRNTCTCGFGKHFVRDDDARMTDAEIIGAYEMVFGSTTEEFTCELQTVDDNSITIFGVDKIRNITINFKEEN